jgi:hypothetical protein
VLLIGVLVLAPLIAGPVAPGRAARAVTVVGTAALLGEAIGALARLHAWFPPDPDLAGLAVKLGVVVVAIGCYALALARVTSARAGLGGRAVAAGGTAGAAAALAWLLLVLLRPEAAATPWPGAGLLLAAALGAVASAPGRRATAGLLAAAGAGLLTGAVMDLLPLSSRWAYHADPPSLVLPAPHRITDPVAMVALGVVAALALTLAARATRAGTAGRTTVPH